MKIGLIVIIAVAILGLLGLTVSNRTSIQPANSTSSATTTSANAPSTGSSSASAFKDGKFTGSAENNEYGTVQIAITINSGKITEVSFLQMPNDMGRTMMLSNMSEPKLKQSTLTNQSANIDFVSGATSTSESYQASLQAALDLAKS